MGLNTGPVYRRVDINTNMNVAGSGINIAQRVMDCGDAGHILMTRRVADFLIEIGTCEDNIHDLGEVVVKHGEKVHLYSFYDSAIGNPNRPTKIQLAG
jgi:class 3 adenylate cyclase